MHPYLLWLDLPNKAKIEKNTLFGMALVRIRTKIEGNTFLVGLWFELQLNKANSSDTKAPFLDLNLSITNGIVSSIIYDKRDDFNS